MNTVERDFMDAADIKGMFLYRKDGYILSYLRVYPFPISLMTRGEKRGKTDILTGYAKTNQTDFDYCTLPMEIDMDRYKQNIKDKYKQQTSIGKRNLLNMMMTQCAELIMNGNNFEHYHYIRIWKMGSMKNKKEVEDALWERITELEKWYTDIGVKCEILQEDEIIKLCNLYGNPLLASNITADYKYQLLPHIE